MQPASNHRHIPGTKVSRNSRDVELAAFDTLPSKTRRALAEAKFKISAVSVAQQFKLGRIDVEQVPEAIAKMERVALRDISMLPVWGAHHPQEIPTRHQPKSLKELDL